MPGGKPAGVRCAQLTPDNLCMVFGKAERPQVCVSYQATEEYCHADRGTAIAALAALETATGGS